MDSMLSQPKMTDLTLPQLLKSLSDPTRLTIVARLAHVDNEVDCSIFDDLGKKSNLSQHYRNLRLNGLISVRRSGRHSYLTLRQAELATVFPGLITTISALTKS